MLVCTLLLLVQANGSHYSLGYFVWITVGRWSTIFQIATFIFGHSSWNSYASATICHSWNTQNNYLAIFLFKKWLQFLFKFIILPAEKSWIDDVSCLPVNRRSLSFPSWGSYAVMWRICCFESLSMAFSISLKERKNRNRKIHYRKTVAL